MPSLETVLENAERDDYEQYLACFYWHQAISSEAYILYASTDPIQAAINAGKAVQKAKASQQHHLQSNYDQLAQCLDQFVTKFVDIASTEEEIHVLLRKEDQEMPESNPKVGALPPRVQDFLNLNYKQV